MWTLRRIEVASPQKNIDFEDEGYISHSIYILKIEKEYSYYDVISTSTHLRVTTTLMMSCLIIFNLLYT